MSKKIIRIIKYAGFLVLSTALYGLVMYFAFTWLSKYSLILAYLGNLVLIVVALVWDEANFKTYDSLLHTKEYLDQLKDKRYFRFLLDSFISFKAALYLYYVLIMIISQVITSYPTLLPETLGNFFIANELSILLLVAVDLFTSQFEKDRKRSAEVLEKFEKAWSEDGDQ